MSKQIARAIIPLYQKSSLHSKAFPEILYDHLPDYLMETEKDMICNSKVLCEEFRHHFDTERHYYDLCKFNVSDIYSICTLEKMDRRKAKSAAISFMKSYRVDVVETMILNIHMMYFHYQYLDPAKYIYVHKNDYILIQAYNGFGKQHGEPCAPFIQPEAGLKIVPADKLAVDRVRNFINYYRMKHFHLYAKCIVNYHWKEFLELMTSGSGSVIMELIAQTIEVIVGYYFIINRKIEYSKHVRCSAAFYRIAINHQFEYFKNTLRYGDKIKDSRIHMHKPLIDIAGCYIMGYNLLGERIYISYIMEDIVNGFKRHGQKFLVKLLLRAEYLGYGNIVRDGTDWSKIKFIVPMDRFEINPCKEINKTSIKFFIMDLDNKLEIDNR